MDSLGLLEQLKRRKVAQWAVTYLAGSWILLQVLSFLAATFAWPALVSRAAVVILGVGFFIAIVIGWYHGEKGHQRVSGSELLILATLVTVAGAAVVFTARRSVATRSEEKPPELAAPAPAAGSIAVLPFSNTSGDPQDEYFSDGMTDELALALARIPAVQVAGRTSSYAFKGKRVAASEIGRALGVAALVEGTVRRSGDRLRVTAQLTSTKDEKVIWSDRFESRSTDVFQVQDDFTAAIAAALAPALSRASGAAGALAHRGTGDLEAYDLYLKGQFFMARRVGDNLMRAAGLFRQAIARDPRFARAYADLAMTYDLMPSFTSISPDSTYPLAFEAANRALALDSTVAHAHLALGLYLTRYDLKLAEGEGHIQRALRLAPNDAVAHSWHAINLGWQGRANDASAAAQRGVQLDPLSAAAASSLSSRLTNSRHFPEAIRAGRRALELDATFDRAAYHLARAYVFNGQPDSAVTVIERVYSPTTPVREKAVLILSYAAAGKWADADRLRAEMLRDGALERSPLAAAYIALAFGDRSAALELVDVLVSPQAARESGVWGEPCDPVLDPIKSDLRYRALLNRYRIQLCTAATPWPIKARSRP